MQYKLLAVALAAAAVGCDPSNSDPGGPVTLERIMVQDAHPFGVRGVAMDLLDTFGSPLSTAVRCDANNPCVTQFLLGGVAPDFSCTPAGVCSDPLAAGLAPLTPPETHRTGEAGGTQLRLVFNKVLSSNNAATDVLEVDDATGAKVAGEAYYDPSGLATSSDPVRSPYGPALVFKPTAPFDAQTQYTIKINAALVHDRSGNPMADQNGTIVSGTFTKTFTTENLTLLPATTLTNVAGNTVVSITSDEILQLGFNAPAAAS
ncbi:MAG: Ig-like domain-containing protein, partial [Polyangia bacterium]